MPHELVEALVEQELEHANEAESQEPANLTDIIFDTDD